MRTIVRWTLVGAVAAAGSWSGSAEAHSPFGVLTGELRTHQVECSTLCTEGELTGGLRGTLEFTMATMTQTEDPNVFLYTGTNVITTRLGTLSGTDHGIWNLATGEFVDYMTFSSATGRYAGSTGSFTIAGKFDPVAGMGQSHYTAALRRD